MGQEGRQRKECLGCIRGRESGKKKLESKTGKLLKGWKEDRIERDSKNKG